MVQSLDVEVPGSDFGQVIQEFLSEHIEKCELGFLGLVHRALHTSCAQHNGQRRRSGEPYLTHPIAVAILVRRCNMSESALIAALLHDCVEDCKITPPEIRQWFGDAVADIVEALTKQKNEDPDEYFDRIIKASSAPREKTWEAAAVKILDRLHNLSCPYSGDSDREIRLLNETVYGGFCKMCIHCRDYIPDEFVLVYDRLVDQVIYLATTRLAKAKAEFLNPAS